MKQRISLLGATGSIGRSTLEVVRHHPERLEVVALTAYGRDIEACAALAAEFRPRLVAVWEEDSAARLRALLPPTTEVASGPSGLLEAATHPLAERVVAAIVGAAGLPAVHAALAAGKDVALANKECLVVAGRILRELAATTGARILPIDSEHAALHQALRCGAPSEVRRLVLTASGGPFLERDLATWDEITPAEALRHPTWSMGAKVTIDSATLMNKGLELVEASHLFGLPPERIDVVIHPQSLVHSLVEYHDGSWMAQLARNDMVFPIQYALSLPERWENRFPRLPFEELRRLDFLPVDERRFPTVRLVRQALAAGESAPAVLNAANEVAVGAFLCGAIRFPQIVDTVAEVLALHRGVRLGSLEDALAWDRWGREQAEARLVARRHTR